MKNWERYLKLHKISTEVGTFGLPKITMCVVIPCYNEPDIMDTIHALEACTIPDKNVVVIVVVNDGENTPKEVIEQNKETYTALVEHANHSINPNLKIIPLYFTGIIQKHAGAGYARKIGMDYAIWIFYSQNNEKGVISSLDADCTVDCNYFSAILDAYARKNLGIATHNFEHPIHVVEEESAIVQYELYLRYFKWALHYCGFPYALYTVGSSFSVLADVYVKHGGMNRRQGGEDFYFLHKVIPHEKFAEINTTTVYPSARMSDRVPFGTGPALHQINVQDHAYEVYTLQSFVDLKLFISGISTLYNADKEGIQQYILQQPEAIKVFLMKEGFISWVEEINCNVSTLKNFVKRFFAKFNAFKIVQFLNETHQKFYVKQPVSNASIKLLDGLKIPNTTGSTYELLLVYRKLDKGLTPLRT